MANPKVWTDDRAKSFANWMIVNKGRSQATVTQYLRSASLFFEWVDEESRKLEPDTVRTWLRHLYFERGCVENTSRACRLAGLRAVCSWLVTNDILQENPTRGVESPAFRAKGVRKLDSETLSRLLTAEDGRTVTSIRNRAVLLLLYATGMRRAEICSLTVDRISLGSSTGRVHIIGKGSKHRSVGFSGPPVEAIHKWILVRNKVAAPDVQTLFVGIGGPTPGQPLGLDGVRMVLKRAARLAGIQQSSVHLHMLRATYATDLYDSGIPVKEIALLLGHSDESMTWKRYIAVSERHLKKARIAENRWRTLGVK